MSDAAASKPTRRWRTRLRWAAVALGLLLIGELALRCCYHEQLKRWTHPDVYQHDDLLGYRYRPGAESRIDWPSISKPVVINSRGYCGKEFDLEKPDGVFRVAVVGTSATGGIWLDGERDFTVQLEELLRAGGCDVECLCFSIDGSMRGTAMIRQIQHEVMGYAPDLVILQIEMPFFGQVPFRTSYRGYGMTYGHSGMSPSILDRNLRSFQNLVDDLESGSRWLYDRLYLVRAYNRWKDRSDPRTRAALERKSYQQRRLVLPGKGARLEIEECERRLVALGELVGRQGAELVLFDTWRSPEMADFAIRSGLRYVVCPVPSGDEFVHEHDGHPSELGHASIAEQLREQLADCWP